MSWLSLALIVATLQTALSIHPDEIQSLPSDSSFWRRAYHASVPLGDYIVIDGGQQDLNLYDNATIVHGLPDTHNDCQVEITILIDMRKSWTNKSVPYSATTAGLILNNEILWPSEDNKTCYAFGGAKTYLQSTWGGPPVSVDQFALTGSNGSWNLFHPASSGWNGLTRPDQAAGATMENTGYIIGGIVNSHSAQDTMILGNTTIPIPGIVSYNITSGQWSNDTAPANISNIFFESVASFGPMGLLIGAGHGDYSPTAPTTVSNLTIYEPVGKTWHTQSTTGEAPRIRNWPCSVALPGDSGTYEIFLYGGTSPFLGKGNLTEEQIADNSNLDEVWVLSLPAFAWFKADYVPKQTRWKHTCNVVGNRQMLSIGGLDPNDANLGSTSKDPIAQGLQIFDLTEMRWTSGYDAGAAPYQSPKVVKDWYNANGGSTKFDDPAVKGFFKATRASNAPSRSSSSGSNSSSTSSNTGAIVGGVIGGIVALAIIALLVWFFLRRRRPRYEKPGHHHHQPPLEDASSSSPGELEDKQRLHELHGWKDGHGVPEVEARPAYSGPFEMGSETRRKG